jgi:hypothetical protein
MKVKSFRSEVTKNSLPTAKENIMNFGMHRRSIIQHKTTKMPKSKDFGIFYVSGRIRTAGVSLRLPYRDGQIQTGGIHQNRSERCGDKDTQDGSRQNDISARQSHGKRNSSDRGLHRSLGEIGKTV